MGDVEDAMIELPRGDALLVGESLALSIRVGKRLRPRWGHAQEESEALTPVASPSDRARPELGRG